MIRYSSFLQYNRITTMDKIGIYMSVRKFKKYIRNVKSKSVIDIGCGYEAHLSQYLFNNAKHLILTDIEVNQNNMNICKRTQIIRGFLPKTLNQLSDSSIDIAILNNVLEHLFERTELLTEIHRILSRNGILLVNVPNWNGKRILELLAFNTRFVPKEEIDDHKIYYNKKELWSELVQSGFTPSKIKLKTHKIFSNTLAICRK